MRKIILFLVILFISFSLQAKDCSTFSGETISTEEIESQDKAISFFWTTWCPHCLSQMKTILSECQNILDKGFSIYFINVQETTRKVSAFKKKLNITLPIIMDSDGSIAYKYRVYGIPTFIFLKDGEELDRVNSISMKLLDKIYDQ